MCILIYKPSNVALPASDILNRCAILNPHGMGFCTPTKFYKSTNVDLALSELSKIDISEPAIIHFRWATHGSIKDANCHPFYDEKTKTYFAHNGMLPIESENDRTDSEICFRTMLQPYCAKGIRSKALSKAVNDIIGGSRFAFMQGRNVKIFGNFYKYEGCYFSNNRPFYYIGR